MHGEFLRRIGYFGKFLKKKCFFETDLNGISVCQVHTKVYDHI